MIKNEIYFSAECSSKLVVERQPKNTLNKDYYKNFGGSLNGRGFELCYCHLS